MKNSKILATIMLVALLSIGTYYGLSVYNNHSQIEKDLTPSSDSGTSQPVGHIQSMGVTLIIENERNGKKIHRMEKDDDLILRSMAGIFHAMVKGSDAEASYIYKVATGASVAFTHSSVADTKIRIGTGTTAPVYENYMLETQVYEDEVEAIGYGATGLQINVTYVATFNILDTYAITEAGFSFPLNAHHLLFRDTFSAISVISGDILTVKYIIMFN